MSIVEITHWAQSAGGRNISLYKSEENPLHPIILIGGVHGDEPEGVALAEATLSWLRQSCEQKATSPKNIKTELAPWIVIPCLNPDGFEKKERTNGNGVDLNRNYPSRNWSPNAKQPRYNPGPHAGSEPEIKALIALIKKTEPRLIIHCHSWEPCIVFTGEPARRDAMALGLCSTYDVRDEIGYPTTGSLSQYGWHDNSIPIICIEEKENTPLQMVWPHFEAGLKKIFVKPKIEPLHQALLATHSAQSISEIQTLLAVAMSKTFDIDWVRIFIHTGDHIDEQLKRLQNRVFFSAPLKLASHTLGRIVFARKSNTKFKRNDIVALKQIADSVALAIDRLAKFEQAENLKQQWDSTFDAIFEPLCLTDEKFNILRTNKAFLSLVNKKHTQVLGLNCFSVFCGGTAPAPIVSAAKAFILERQNKIKNLKSTYEVSTQRIRTDAKGRNLLLTIFRDITNQRKIEKQIFESSKMAELGTIGSSIAHDINNPLGGMLNFLQLIKNDLAPDDAIYEDILQMETAGLRCKEIVENLLRFSRKQDVGAPELVDLKEVVEHALKIVNLQTRSIGIDVKFIPPKEKIAVTSHFNLLSQVLSHVLQNAFEAVSEKLTQSPRYKGIIQVKIFNAPEGPGIQIVDNGVGITPELQNKILNPMFSTKRKKQNQGLGLTLAYQIIDDLGGQLEISSQPNVETQVKIYFKNV